MAVISVTYDEGSNKDNLMNNNEKIFNSGDFVRDWYQLWKFIHTAEINEPIMYSSSVDHFIMDGAPFDSGYLHFVEDKPVLKYPSREGEHWFLNSDFDGLEVFVPEGTKPTWEEYVELYSGNSTEINLDN
jgi:hypothetical protein